MLGIFGFTVYGSRAKGRGLGPRVEGLGCRGLVLCRALWAEPIRFLVCS